MVGSPVARRGKVGRRPSLVSRSLRGRCQPGSCLVSQASGPDVAAAPANTTQ